MVVLSFNLAPMTLKKIAIVGTGIAGLSCAKQLIKAGHEVTLFEKSKGVGGRMSNRKYEQWQADHGAQYFTISHPKFVNEVSQWLEHDVAQTWHGKIVNYCNGNISEINRDRNRYVGTPTMTAPAKFLANNLTIQTSQTIIGIKKVNQYWQLVSEEYGLCPGVFDFLILAIPPIQAQKIMGKESASLTAFCQQAKMLPCWTLIAYFKEALTLPFDAAFVQDSIFSWIARDNSKPGRPTTNAWVAQANPDWSLQNLELPKIDAEKTLIDTFEQLCGTKSAFNQVHLWRYAKLETPITQNFAIDSNAQLGICGDWLRASKVEDAWLSGYFLGLELSGQKPASA